MSLRCLLLAALLEIGYIVQKLLGWEDGAGKNMDSAFMQNLFP